MEKNDVIVRYNHELLHIKNKLNQLENGTVYDISNIKMDGLYCSKYKRIEGDDRNFFIKSNMAKNQEVKKSNENTEREIYEFTINCLNQNKSELLCPIIQSILHMIKLEENDEK